MQETLINLIAHATEKTRKVKSWVKCCGYMSLSSFGLTDEAAADGSLSWRFSDGAHSYSIPRPWDGLGWAVIAPKQPASPSSPPRIPAQKGPRAVSSLTTFYFPWGTAGSRSCKTPEETALPQRVVGRWGQQRRRAAMTSPPRRKHQRALSPLSYLTVKSPPQAHWLVVKRHLCVGEDKALKVLVQKSFETCTGPETCKSRDGRD